MAELRRLYDIDRFVGLRVYALRGEVLVELPEESRSEAGIIDLAQSHGGHSQARSEGSQAPARPPDEASHIRGTGGDAGGQGERSRDPMREATWAIERTKGAEERESRSGGGVEERRSEE